MILTNINQQNIKNCFMKNTNQKQYIEEGNNHQTNKQTKRKRNLGGRILDISIKSF